MKKKLTKALALVLLLCMLLPQTALAYTTYYIEVTISDEGGKTVTGESSHYATLQEPLAAAVVGVITDKYTDLETVFAMTGLRGIVDSGVEAFRGGDAAWSAYVDTYNDGVQEAFKEVLKDKTSTYADLTPNEKNILTWTDEDDGMLYTVTITLRRYSSDTDDYSVAVSAESKGYTTVSRTSADAGDKVTITASPAEGWMVNQVSVTDRNGNPVTVTAVSENVYTFIMPAAAVTVTVTTKLRPADPDRTGISRLLNTDDRIAYMQGLDDGDFHPYDPITRAQVAMIFYRLLRDADVAHGAPFTDVADGAWYAEAVNTLAALGIVKGVSEDTFAPDVPITRAQFVAICARFADSTVSGYTFEDVPENYWARDYISTAAAYGWVNGVSATEFAPDRAITRAEGAAMVNRVLARIADRAHIDSLTDRRYEDVTSANWAWYDINEASMGVLPR